MFSALTYTRTWIRLQVGVKRCSSRASLASSLKKGINNPANNCIVARELFRTFGLTCCTRLHTCIFLFSIFPGGKFRFVNSPRNTNATYVSREKRIFSFKSVLLLSESQFRFVTLEGYIHIYVLRLAKVEGVKRDFRDGKNIFRRWATPICRRGRQTLEQTRIRICICKGTARRLPRFALSFCFHRRGNIGIGADLLLPLEPFWQRASWGRYTMTKGRKGEGRKKKEGKNATLLERSNSSTDGNKQSAGSAARGGGGTRGGVIQGVPLISSRKIGHEMH